VIDDEGSNISAGEKQLITIARAFLAKPALLILDEATSSVDTRTESLLQHAMAALRTNRTSFVIAHRLSTIRDADLILMMEVGQIVERGTHDELIALDGAYAALYNSQFAGPEVEPVPSHQGGRSTNALQRQTSSPPHEDVRSPNGWRKTTSWRGSAGPPRGPTSPPGRGDDREHKYLGDLLTGTQNVTGDTTQTP